MGWNAVQPLLRDDDPKTVMVVFVGAGHVQYGLGIERQVKEWFRGKVASVIPVAVEDEKKKPIQSVQASYASFVWGTPPEADPLYPELGLSTRLRDEGKLLEVIDVEKDSPASRAGIRVGDVLLAMDAVSLSDRETLARLMAGKRWGDSAVFAVAREKESVSLTILLRRELKAPPSP
jgi:S1-C subfamily serine protease